MNLDIKNWKEFRIGDLFKLQRGHTLTVEQKEEFVGAVPCVNGTIENNGVQCYLSKDVESVGFNLVKSPKSLLPLMMKGGYRAMTEKKDPLHDFDTNLTKYDKIVIGSPVWDDRLAPATNAILDILDLKDKKPKFILYSGSGKAQKATEKIKELYNIEPIILKSPKNHKQELEKLKNI